MNRQKLDLWAKQTAEEGRLLSEDELKEVLMKAGEKLLREAVYEPVGDSGTVYKRTSSAPGATIR